MPICMSEVRSQKSEVRSQKSDVRRRDCEQALNLNPFFEVLVLADEKAHACAGQLDAVAQRQVELVRLVDHPLEGRQSRQSVKGMHMRSAQLILPVSSAKP